MGNKQKPDLTNVNRGLKDFQKNSVDYVFKRFYEDLNTTNRFLIADEVGLGKTLVAKGVIAKAINHLWDKVKRLDVIYICSNTDIARQNIRRLKVTDNGFSLASRITLLPSKLKELNENKLNFISFTPGTSFNLRSSTGVYQERALLYWILREAWDFGSIKGPVNLLQCDAYKDNWRKHLKKYPRNMIDPELKESFIRAINESDDLKNRFEDLIYRFRHYKENIPREDRWARNKFIGDVREKLAVTCIHALKPDLIILDEFQRFKYLLDKNNPTGQLAHELFGHENENFGVDTKTLLLSATPYKMYTMDHERDTEDHYEDFLKTLEFLYDENEKLAEFKKSLKHYREELYQVNNLDHERLLGLKDDIQKHLKQVMIRTERLSMTEDRNGMVEDYHRKNCGLDIEEITSFRMVDKLSDKLKTGNCVEYWKSAPYLLNFMDDYALKRNFNKSKDEDFYSMALFLKQNRKELLSYSKVKQYQKVDPKNHKLKYLFENNVDKGWDLLWVPPSLPYYEPEGVYAEEGKAEFTKSLVFSSWKVVPKVIASLTSYEAERRMIKSFRKQANYREIRKQLTSLLQFNISGGQYSGRPVLGLLYPCLTLSRKVDPLDISVEGSRDGSVSLEYMYNEIKEKLELLLNEAVEGAGIEQEYQDTLSTGQGQADERWYTAALALLDRYFYKEEAGRWLMTTDESLSLKGTFKVQSETDQDKGFRAHIDMFVNYFNDPTPLGRKPDNLMDVLTKMALASPAVIAHRAFSRKINGKLFSEKALRKSSEIAQGFRSLYNLPDSIALIRSVSSKAPYWEQVLEYGMEGNIQSVLDEFIHVLYESQGLIGESEDGIIETLSKEIVQSLMIRSTRTEFDDLKVKVSMGKVEPDKCSIRCRYGMRFQEGRNDEDDEVTREDQVRRAFNSPFRPFVLATTSIGQEGLDFHQYCRSIYHWNLPSNPVDLEQREGRIHRYKGHVIRQNIAKTYEISSIQPHQGNGLCLDPWDQIFDKAIHNRKEDENDLNPFWIFETKDGYKIERHVPVLPFSRDISRIAGLKNTLTLYRMVLGQPRQEELLDFLRTALESEDVSEEILQYRIDLSP